MMLTIRFFAIPLAVAASGLAVALGPSQGHADTTGDAALKDASEFSAIADLPTRSKALFQEASRILTHPRCMNCHPATRTPTQGEDMHAHVPVITAVESAMGPAGLACSACHGPENRAVLGSRLKTVPGNSHWSLAPESMAWQGLSVGEICRQLKDPSRNGERSLADIVHHMSEDHLVGWAWNPGEGRSPAPGTQQVFGALIAAWIDTGAACPD